MRQQPSVYTVDRHGGAPPLPPRAGRDRQCGGLAQTLLFVLVSVALMGLVVEALLIFYLHTSQSVQKPSTLFSRLTAEKSESPPHLSTHHNPLSKPHTRPMEKNASPHTCTPHTPLSKPVARLIRGKAISKSKLGWSLIFEPLLRGIDYEDGNLLIRQEGFYFVYSKLSFHNAGDFHHMVMRRTRRHPTAFPLLQARKYSSAANSKDNHNTFLGGVFHLDKHDALFAKVSDTSKIVHVLPDENVFGAFMI
ncbi:tumor necrosis factor ligand superfamily member 14 [Vanacampus margaritifer]